MKFKFKGNEYTYDELKDAKVNLIIDICKSLNMEYRYYAPFLYKNRNVIITEFFNKQTVNDCENNEKGASEEEKNEKPNENNEEKIEIESEINKIFEDISKIDIESIFENVNDAIININQDEIINKGSKFAEDVVLSFDEFLGDTLKNTKVQDDSQKPKNDDNQKPENDNYTPILALEKNKYDYDFKNKFANAFKRFRTLDENTCKMLVLSGDNSIKLEKIIFNFTFADDILHVKCDVENDVANINADKFDIIFLDENINSVLIKNIIKTVSDLNVEMLNDDEIQVEVNLINNYIDNGEINILLNYKNLEKVAKEVTENKIIFYKNIQGDNQIIISEDKNECDVKRIKTAKALKLFIKSDLSKEEAEFTRIDFTSLEIRQALDDKYNKYENIGELDLIINFKKIDNEKLSYRIFVKQDGQLMHSDNFIVEF